MKTWFAVLACLVVVGCNPATTMIVLILLGLVATHVHAQTPAVLASFNGSNGQNPYAALTLSGSRLYGTTRHGGENGGGTVFSLPVSGGTPTVLASFNGSNGQFPLAGLTLGGDGNTLYGTTDYGGAYGDGTVFAVTVPEPSTLILFAAASMGLAACSLWRRRESSAAAPTSDQEDDHILTAP